MLPLIGRFEIVFTARILVDRGTSQFVAVGLNFTATNYSTNVQLFEPMWPHNKIVNLSSRSCQSWSKWSRASLGNKKKRILFQFRDDFPRRCKFYEDEFWNHFKKLLAASYDITLLPWCSYDNFGTIFKNILHRPVWCLTKISPHFLNCPLQNSHHQKVLYANPLESCLRTLKRKVKTAQVARKDIAGRYEILFFFFFSNQFQPLYRFFEDTYFVKERSRSTVIFFIRGLQAHSVVYANSRGRVIDGCWSSSKIARGPARESYFRGASSVSSLIPNHVYPTRKSERSSSHVRVTDRSRVARKIFLLSSMHDPAAVGIVGAIGFPRGVQSSYRVYREPPRTGSIKVRTGAS